MTCAVFDGARAPDLAARLTQARLQFSLLFQSPDPGEASAGPHLVRVDTPAQQAALAEALDADAAPVWWLWPAGLDAKTELYRHLRTLNQVEIPRDRYDASEPPPPGASAYERVIFRHADPNVLAQFWAVLSEAQKRRFVGAARRVVFYAPGFGGRTELEAPETAPSPHRGPLRLSPDQYDRLGDARGAASRDRIAAYLRRVAPEQTRDWSDEHLRDYVKRAEISGRRTGLRSERALGKWAFLSLVTHGAIERDAYATSVLREGGPNPDANLDTLFDALITAKRAQEVG